MASLRRFAWTGLVIGALLVSRPVASAAPPRQGTDIQYNQTVQGSLSDAAPEQHWFFSGYAGDLILIDMRADEPDILDTFLTLLDANGMTLMTDDDGGDGFNSRIGPYQLPADGRYEIIAARYTGMGGYSLELQSLTALPTLRAGKPLVGVVNASNASEFFLVQPDSGPLMRLAVTDDDPTADPFLALYGPDGLIASTEFEETQTGAIDPIFTLPGEVYVVVVSWNVNTSGGPYELALGPSEISLMEMGVPQTGALDYETILQRHYFRGEAGQAVRVTVTTDDPIVPALEITTLGEGTWLFASEGAAMRETSVVLTISASGLYAVGVHDSSYSGESGTYTITVTAAE